MCTATTAGLLKIAEASGILSSQAFQKRGICSLPPRFDSHAKEVKQTKNETGEPRIDLVQ
jgi:hypothetical protein